ncbi:MAG: glycoside hydrolase family 31 protein [Chloroflexota bacterium]
MTQPTNVRLVDSSLISSTLAFAGECSERFQVSVLADDLIHVQMFPNGRPRFQRTWLVVGQEDDVPCEGRLRDDLSPFPLPAFQYTAQDDRIQVWTQQLRLEISLDNFAINWFDAGGHSIAADLAGRAYAYDRAGAGVWHYLEHRAGEHYFGFGERSGELDKVGRRMRMLNLDAFNYDAEKTDPLYKHFPFYITFIPGTQTAYGLFYDNLATSVFEMGGELDAYHGAYRYYQAEDGDIDYYLIYGPSIEQVVEKLSALIGRPILPPRWSLGYLGSTMSYTEAPDAQTQLQRFVELCNAHQIPCDLFHLSSGYTLDENGKRNVFTWDRNRIPDPSAMVENFARAGIKLTSNIKPALLLTHPSYTEVAAFGGFIKQAHSHAPEVVAFWGGQASYLDFTHPQTLQWWKQNVREQLLEYGIVSMWNDNNENEIWDDEARCAGFGEPFRIAHARPLQTLLMVRASYEAQKQYRPDERPYLISRSGCPGIQRYAQTWSGDNVSNWETLKYNIPMGLGLSLSGAPNTGHDVGGFCGNAPSPELFVRWVQNGVFHPRFTIHSYHSDGSVNEPWMYPEVLSIIREWIEFRYRLIPYLYTLLFESTQTGHPIIRPMVYEFPADPKCQTESFDFMLGPNLLVASVLQDGARRRSVYLPAGSEWCDWYTGEWYTGGQVISADAPLERIPLFVRAGGLIPMGKVMRHVGAEPDEVRQVFVFPHPTSGCSEFTLIEDDGLTLAYQRGEYSEVKLEVSATSDCISLQAARRGNYRLPYHRIEFILPPNETRHVIVSGETWTDAQGCGHALAPVE